MKARAKTAGHLTPVPGYPHHSERTATTLPGRHDQACSLRTIAAQLPRLCMADPAA